MRFGFTFFLVSALAATLNIPAFAAASGDDPKVIYGTDDRLDVFEVTDPAILAAVDATCLVVSASILNDNGDGTFTLDTQSYEDFLGLPPCEGEPFATQPLAAGGFGDVVCSGWLAGDDIIVTAGHCARSSVTGLRFIFGYEMIDADTPITTFESDQVYAGVELLSQDEEDRDHAVIRVDREVTAPGASPLPFRTTGEIAVGTQIGVIGHPVGLPTKIAFGPQTTVRDEGDPELFFVTNLDTYGGNSGSAVGRVVSDPVKGVDEFFVEGILVFGRIDFVVSGSCRESAVHPDSQGAEKVTRTTLFADAITNPLPPSCLALGPSTRSVSWPLGDGLLFGLAVALCVIIVRRGKPSVE